MSQGIIQAHQMGFFVGERHPQRSSDRCPECGGVKSKAAETCIVCRPVKEVRRSAEAMDNHHRWNAALMAGWGHDYMVSVRPFYPSWQEILDRCPEAVMPYHPEMVIERWWKNSAT